MAISYDKLLQSLKNKKFEPVYFLHGEETYFIDAITDYIEKNALTEAEKGFNQVVIYGKDTDADSIVATARRYPMMSEKQVVIVKEAQFLKGLGGKNNDDGDEKPDKKQSLLEGYIEKPVPSTLLVIAYKYKTLDKRLKLYKLLDKNAVLFESAKVKENTVPEWITKYLEEKGKKITQKAALLLTEYIGNDLENIVNALEKLSIANNTEDAINEKDIEDNIGISREYNIFELTAAIGTKNKVKASKIIEYMGTHTKEHPLPMIMGFLYSYFSKIAAMQLKPGNQKEALKAMGVMDWLQKEYTQAEQNYKGKLKPIMHILHEYDLRSKGVNDTGTGDAQLLKEMMYRIMYI